MGQQYSSRSGLSDDVERSGKDGEELVSKTNISKLTLGYTILCKSVVHREE